MPIRTPGQPTLQGLIENAFKNVRDLDSKELTAKQIEASNARIIQLSQELSKAIDDHVAGIIVTIKSGITVTGAGSITPAGAVTITGTTTGIGTS